MSRREDELLYEAWRRQQVVGPPRERAVAPFPSTAAGGRSSAATPAPPAAVRVGPATARHAEIGRGLDVHELLKREAFGADDPRCADHFEKNRPCPDAPLGVSDQYLTLDSFLKLPSSRIGAGEFQWNFMVQGVTGDEVIGVRSRIETVTEAQLMPFVMPIPEEVPYTTTPTPLPPLPTGRNTLILVKNNANAPPLPDSPVLEPNAGIYGQYPPGVLISPATTATPWVNNPYTQLPFSDRLTVQLKEAGLQSFSDRNGARHHFECSVTFPGLLGANPNMLRAEPLWDTYLFEQPLQALHGLTLVFRNPDVPVSFLPDCLYGTVAANDGSAVAPGSYLRFTYPGHRLNVGDRVFVAGFASGNADLDSYVNRAEGHVASAAPGTGPPFPTSGEPIPTPDDFWLDPAVSLVDIVSPPPALPQTVTVFVAKRRLRLSLRLRCIVDRLTNYVQPAYRR